MKTLKKILALSLMLPALFLTACGKDGGSSATTTTTTTTGYYWGTNGACYLNGVQQANTSLCAQNTGYQIGGNGICYQVSTGQQVNTSYCYNGNTTAGVGCYGLYRWNNYTVQCNGADCRGYTLINLTTGVSQYCQ